MKHNHALQDGGGNAAGLHELSEIMAKMKMKMEKLLEEIETTRPPRSPRPGGPPRSGSNTSASVELNYEAEVVSEINKWVGILER